MFYNGGYIIFFVEEVKVMSYGCLGKIIKCYVIQIIYIRYGEMK